MEISELVVGAAKTLGAQVEQDDKTFFVTLALDDDADADADAGGDADGAASKADDEEGVTAMVAVYPDEDGETLIVSADAGPCDADADFAGVLRGLSSVMYARVYLDDPDDEGEHLFVEAGLPLATLAPEQLAQVVQEVADIADWLDDFLFEEEDDEE